MVASLRRDGSGVIVAVIEGQLLSETFHLRVVLGADFGKLSM